MSGVPRSSPITIDTTTRSVVVHLGAHWQSGLYFARLSARDGRVGFAPFVLRPRRLGTSRVAVVLPTNTWAAYNFLDVDGNGVGDTWYADPSIHVVDLRRPFSRRGVPPHFRAYDAGFLEWLAKNHLHPDVLTDDDLERIHDGKTLARLYDLIVFSGHEEYVTPHEFTEVSRYRDLGGNLAFLSANNFFYRVVHRGHTIIGRTKFRDLGRPEAALVGVQYVNWFEDRYRNRPYLVVGTQRAPWLFTGSGLHDGSRFGNYGIEIDARARSSPPNLRVLARIPNIFGPGQSAEMAYYQTRAGAKVFAAGTINFGGTALFPEPSRILHNLWRRLSVP
jgi:N,N-dimethylformamidase beta subunit-like protein